MSVRGAFTSAKVLWVAQIALAAVFLLAGAIKLAMPMHELSAQTGLPGGFMKFIAVCEVLGGLGLVLPGLARVRLGLTPLAAAGLVIIMIGAVVVTAVEDGVASMALPLCVGIAAAAVAYGRAPYGAGDAARRRAAFRRAR
jgi:uncharacterized membrane protein YphA (DoxX/SURF4 family)